MEEKIFYVTKKKLEEVKKEYAELVELERKKATKEEAPKILESEDLNPEFVSFKDDIGFLRSRIDELKNVLDHNEIIRPPSREKLGVVGVGAKVKIDVDGQKEEFMVVGTLEANPAMGKISNESPVGKALLGHKVGDVIVISSPMEIKYKIRNIKYETN